MMKALGFTLIELMIVVAIIGILAAIAYPSYNDAIMKSRRSDGKAALTDLATRMERYYSENHTYATATIGAGAATDVLPNNQSPEGWYQLRISAQDASSYTVQAVPQAGQAALDTGCATLTLNNQGVQGVSGATAAATCW